MKTESDYTAMQKNYYEAETVRMKEANHSQHNANPDYWNILLAPLNGGDWSEKVTLDFGCGCGRNVENILTKWNVKEAHGCDISQNNVTYCESNVSKSNHKFFVTDGQSLRPADDDTYDLITSTIVLQHIPVYNIRKKILTDMFRVLKPGGILSIQMGYGHRPGLSAGYYDNATDASGTNGHHDTMVSNPHELIGDLEEIGFTNVVINIRQPWDDVHAQWIYATGTKP